MILMWQQQKNNMGKEGHHPEGGEGGAGPISKLRRIIYGA